MPEPINQKLQDIIDTVQTSTMNVEIVQCNRGWIVHIGCTRWVFEKKDEMLEAISLFLDDPDDVKEYFNERYSELLGVDSSAPVPEERVYSGTADCATTYTLSAPSGRSYSNY